MINLLSFPEAFFCCSKPEVTVQSVLQIFPLTTNYEGTSLYAVMLEHFNIKLTIQSSWNWHL